MHDLSIIIPIYKEKDNFENLIKKIYYIKIILISELKMQENLG